MAEAYLIYDIGTGNSRVALVSGQFDILDIQTFENRYYRDFSYTDAQYFKPAEMLEQILKCTKEIIRRHPEIIIRAVTATSARESIVLLDETGDAFYGLPNIDNRGALWLSDIPGQDEIYCSTGRWVSPVFSAGKLVGLKKIHPDIYGKIKKIVSLSDWLGYVLTGELVMEYSQACETQLFDIGNWEWSEELCQRFGIDRKILPKLSAAGTSLGKISTSFGQASGIPGDAVFVVGGADTQMAVKGICLSEGETAVVSGTTSPIVTIVPDKFYDEKKRCWVDCYIDGKSYQVETNAGVSGMNYQRMKQMFFKDVDYGTLDREMEKKRKIRCVASLGTLVFSENKTLENGGFYMRAPLDGDMDRFDFAYALIADIACSIVLQYENLSDLISQDRDYILGCGGGFQSRVLCQMLADLTHKKLLLKEGYTQASLSGCAGLCNTYLGVEKKECLIRKEFIPSTNDMLEEYYEKWEAVRKLIN